jgi:hypothetical protein
MIGNYRYFNGGFALSARHLAPILPFLALPLAFGLRKMPRTGEVLTAISIGLMTLGTSIDAILPTGIAEPVTQFYVPKLLRGEVVETLASVFGIHGIASVLPLALIAGFLILSLLSRTRSHPLEVPTFTWKHLETFAIDTTFLFVAAFLFFAVRPGLVERGGLHAAATITPVSSPLITVIAMLFIITVAWYVVQVVLLLPALRQVAVHGARRIGYTLQRLWTPSPSKTGISSTASADHQMTLSI